MIVVVDYGMGNLRSIVHKLNRAGVLAAASGDPVAVERADKLILPGVGHFAEGMRNLRERGLIEVLCRQVLKRCTPILGICLGMQLLTESSEEGDVAGLGWLGGRTRRFAAPDSLRVPHVGWNTLEPQGELWAPVAHQQRFYFSHSYHLCDVAPEDTVATTHYGYDFVSVIRHQHIHGTQFHPEKSHRRGFELVEAFARST